MGEDERVRKRQGFKRLTKRNANQYYHSKTVYTTLLYYCFANLYFLSTHNIKLETAWIQTISTIHDHE